MFVQRPTAEWIAMLEAVDVPVSPILSIGDLLKNSHLAARDLFRTIHTPEQDLQVAGQPLRMSSHVQNDRPLGPPELGADTRDVLASILNINDDEYHRLQTAGAVA